MFKEIYEQFSVVQCILEGCFGQNQVMVESFGLQVVELFVKVCNVQIVVCGISYYVGMVVCYWLESLIGIFCQVEVVSEFCYCKVVVQLDCLFVIIFQFGEIVDILVVLCNVKELGFFFSVVICNVVISLLVCEFDLILLIQVGLEIGVVLIKVFIIQLVVLLLLILGIGQVQKCLVDGVEVELVDELCCLLIWLGEVLVMNWMVEKVFELFVEKYYILFFGCGVQFLVVLEGVLKFKEIFYIYVEVYLVGEFKYGLLVLVDSDMLVVIVVLNNELVEKFKLNLQEVCVCGGELVVFVDEGVGIEVGEGIYVVGMLYIGDVFLLIFYIILL